MALEVSVEKTLHSLYAQYKIVTFDIFDTLVHRKVRAPVDVFEMVRLKAFEIEDSWKHHDTFDRFPDDRILAENLAREKRRADSLSEGEVTFDEIYESFAKISLLPIETIKSSEAWSFPLKNKSFSHRQKASNIWWRPKQLDAGLLFYPTCTYLLIGYIKPL